MAQHPVHWPITLSVIKILQAASATMLTTAGRGKFTTIAPVETKSFSSLGARIFGFLAGFGRREVLSTGHLASLGSPHLEFWSFLDRRFADRPPSIAPAFLSPSQVTSFC